MKASNQIGRQASTDPLVPTKQDQTYYFKTILRPPKRLTAIGQEGQGYEKIGYCRSTRCNCVAFVNSRCVSRLTYIHKCGGTACGSYYRGMGAEDGNAWCGKGCSWMWYQVIWMGCDEENQRTKVACGRFSCIDSGRMEKSTDCRHFHLRE